VADDLVKSLNLHRHAVIEASAGTGKTYTLEQLVLRLLTEEGAQLEQILLVTYTEKATGELKTRLRSRLEQARDKHPEIIQAALDTFDQANISTIHGFCQRVLQEYAFENRQDFRPQLVNDGELLQGCLRELQRRQWRQEYGRRLPMVLELAGYAAPGAGPKWEHLVGQLAMSFRPGCGHELRPRAEQDWLAALDRLETDLQTTIPKLRNWSGPVRLERIEEHPWNLGFAALTYRPDSRELRRTCVLLPLLRWLGHPATDTAPLAMFRRLLAECESPPFARSGFEALTDLSTKANAELPACCPRLIETVRELERLREACGSLALTEKLTVNTVRQIQEQLAITKQDRGQQSFEDMLTRLHSALHADNRRAAALTAILRERFRWAIVDEFQDTDPIQWGIFKKLFVESDAHRLYVVGDPKQAIFGFRGADYATFVQARDHLVKNCAADRRSLDVNWRSSPHLLAALNRLFGQGGWFTPTGIDYTEVSAPPEQDQRNRIVQDKTNPSRAALNLVDLTHCARLADARRDMARFITDEIGRLLSGENGESAIKIAAKGKEQWLKADNICILVANRRRDAAPIIEALREAGIPYTFYKQPGLWQAPEVVHLEYVLRALARPEETSGFNKALLTRFYRIRPEDLASCEELPYNHAARELFSRWRELAEQRRWAELFGSLLEDTGVLFVDPEAPEAERSLANYRHIFLTLQQAAYAKDLDLFGLLDVLRELRRQVGNDETDLQPMETDQPKVKILTIHAAKGLEYPVVFLAGGFTKGQTSPWTSYHYPPDQSDQHVVFNLCPDNEAIRLAAKERNAEERRLYYVALTRAMFKLYVPMLGEDRDFGKWGGPIWTILAPAIGKAKLADEESELVGTVKTTSGRGPIRLMVPPVERSAKPQAAPIQVGELFPVLDADIPQRRLAIRSFSSLHRELGATVPTYFDAVLRADDDSPDALEEEALLRGPVFGSITHAVLENLDFAAVLSANGPESLLTPGTQPRELIDSQLQLHLAEFPVRGDEEELANACRLTIARLIFNTLHTPLVGLGGPLAAIPASDRLHELEFDFPEADLTHLKTPPPELRRQEGFFTGIMDLVVRKGSKFFLIDWKTNHLPGSYTPAELRQSMDDCDYHRQYRLYLQALARWLKRVHGKSPDPARDFGGVYYLYLRGMNGQDESSGVFCHKPTRDDLRLERVLGE
jgi:exodeoxyribonuclease V beta subunit